jgi:hypothetical protein
MGGLMMTRNPADGPLDGTDTALLDEVAQLYQAVDPVPHGLIDRLSFSLALDELYAEVAAVSRVTPDAVGVRSDPTDVRTQTLTFSAESLTAMITVTHMGPDQVRVDGWVAPAHRLRVRLRTPDDRLETLADDAGRFSFQGLPGGFVQLSFHAEPDEGGPPTVVTPSFEL